MPKYRFILILILIFSLNACYNRRDSNLTSIEIDLGEDVAITLASNPTTGFSWQLAEAPDKNILELKESKYIPYLNPLLGSGGQELRVFKTIAKGKAEITLEYRRPWEKGVPPAKQAKFLVIVQ